MSKSNRYKEWCEKLGELKMLLYVLDYKRIDAFAPGVRVWEEANLDALISIAEVKAGLNE